MVPCLIVAVLGVAGLVAPRVAAAAVVNDAAAPLAWHGAFRLGTGAGPLGWSTAVADFNQDGEPDIAVLDRAGRSSRGYAYRIELMVSAAAASAASAVRFETAHPSVLIAVRDVDRDRHPDLVVTSALVHDVIGVWLNDGDGRFEQSAVRPEGGGLPPGSRIVSPRPAAAATMAARAAGWRDEAPCRASGAIVACVAAHVRSGMPEPRPRGVRLSESLTSRAPPALLG